MTASILPAYEAADRVTPPFQIEALVASGMDASERLLLLNEATIKNIPGIGAVALAEIRTYRGRFAMPAATGA